MQPMLNTALAVARSTAELIARATEDLKRITVETKGKNDYVTRVDQAAEQRIIEGIQKRYPDHGFLGEENGVIEGSGAGKDFQWIIDPLDGTTNFIHGMPHFAISIALKVKQQLEVAIVLDPMRQEEFTAVRGRGAQLNGKRIRVSSQTTLDGALLATGIPFRPDQYAMMDEYLSIFKSLALNTAGIRRAGSAALDLAYVAAGRYDGYWEFGLKEWDMAAGALLLQEAGGLIGDTDGTMNHLSSGNVVCGPVKVFKAILQTIHNQS